MKDLIHLILSILYCWSNGFGVKTGAELFLLEEAKRENKRFPRGSQRNPHAETTELQRKYAARLAVRK